MNSKPKIGITMGDPNGVGAEVIVKALACSELQGLITPVVFGSPEILEKAAGLAGLGAEFEVIAAGDFRSADLSPGKNDIRAGALSLACIEKAVELALLGKIAAVVTAPISKAAIHMAGCKYPGHTEMLADLTGSKNVVMMFDGAAFRVALATIHCALQDVPALISRDTIISQIGLINESLISLFGIQRPKIAVCGLNPHAGEAGAFGHEEETHITPAVETAREMGIEVEGPMPADTLFYYASKGRWDAVFAMYHDQGLIPFKMLSFDDGVNFTIGLPIIRTSPDHGTAFDIAWRGKANPSSMIAAIKLAFKMVGSKKARL